MERQLKNADHALGNRATPASAQHSGIGYDMGLLNLECRYNIARVVQASSDARPWNSVLLGPTWQWQNSARHASDLRGKYVGDTEQAMAALRRFTFKILFKPLSAAQKERAFVALACTGSTDCLTRDLKARLGALEHLCLGDFAAVQRQTVILDALMQPSEFLQQLEAEYRVKPEVRESRRLGFLA